MVEMTIEQKRISRRNRYKAREYFGIIGQPNKVLHHKDHSLRHNNIERYILWLPEDLEVLDKGTHSSLHDKEMWKDEDHRKRCSVGLAKPGWNKGIPCSEETKAKLRESLKGREPWNKGKEMPHNDEWNNNLSISIQKSYDEGRIPPVEGKVVYNNGIVAKYFNSDPGEPWVKGRLPGTGGSKKGSRPNRHWFNNGITEVWLEECPEGYSKGRLKKKR